MSILNQLYGEAKGVNTSLKSMNDNLESLLEADKKYYKAEEKERNREYNQQRRSAQDRSRLQQQVHESIDASNKIGKGGNKKAVDTFAKGMAGILTAILAAYGIKKGMDHFGGGGGSGGGGTEIGRAHV